MHPRPMAETSRLLVPSLRYCILSPSRIGWNRNSIDRWPNGDDNKVRGHKAESFSKQSVHPVRNGSGRAYRSILLICYRLSRLASNLQITPASPGSAPSLAHDGDHSPVFLFFEFFADCQHCIAQSACLVASALVCFMKSAHEFVGGAIIDRSKGHNNSGSTGRKQAAG